MRIRFLILVVACLIALWPVPRSGQAQSGESCAALVARAFAEVALHCANLERGSACYGFSQVTAALNTLSAGQSFARPGDRTALTVLQSLSAAPLDPALPGWGIAVMRVQANLPAALPDLSALFLLLGEARVENAVAPEEALLPADPLSLTSAAQADLRLSPGLHAAIADTLAPGAALQADGVTPDGNWLRVLSPAGLAWVHREAFDPAADLSSLPVIDRGSRTPMQAFRFSTGDAASPCPEAPPAALVIQAPPGYPVEVTANGVDLRIDSLALLRTLPGGQMQIAAGDGRVTLWPGEPDAVTVLPGAAVTMPLGPNDLTTAAWTDWRLLTQAEWDSFDGLESLSTSVWNTPYVGPTIIQPSGVGGAAPLVQTLSGAATVSPPPTRLLFPRLPVSYGEPGSALSVTPWQPVSVGPAVCPDWMLYHSDRSGDWDVYRLGSPAGGGALNNVSQGVGSMDVDPTYSQDGAWVAFSSDRDPTGGWEIWLATADGSQQQRLTANTAADVNPVWGPGGLLIFESNRDGNWELYLLDVTVGGDPVRLTNDPGNDVNAFWAPDGSAVYFQSDRDGDWELFRLNLPQGNVEQITFNTTQDMEPSVAHGGKLLAWRQLNSYGVYDLWLMDLTTGQARQLTDAGVDVGGHLFSPDDSLIAYHANVDGDFDVFVVEVESGAIKNITANDGIEDRAPGFWCGSTTVIYHSDGGESADNPGQRDVFQVEPLPIDGPANIPLRLTDGAAEDVYPLGDPRQEVNSREGRVPETR